MKDSIKSYGLKIVNSIYDASVYSVLAYSAILLALAVIGMAIGMRMIDVPEFHPK